jgi:ABC-type Na+ efflux pump permease subunit
MLRRLWISLRRDSLINLRNHYLTVTVLAALVYLIFATVALPANLSAKPDIYLVDQTGDGRYAASVEQQAQQEGTAGKLYRLGSVEEVVSQMEANQNSVGMLIEDDTPLPRVTLYMQAHHNERVRNLLAVAVEAQLRELYGEPWPQQVELQQQFLRPQAEETRIPFNHLFVPFMLFSDAAMIGMLLIVALIFMEKEEGTLMAYLVTPGKVFEYLVSKALSLAVLAVVFTAILVPLVLGTQPNYLHLLAVIVMTSIFTSLLGAWFGLYFENLSQAMFPMVILVVVLGIPAVAYMIPSFSPLWLQWLPTYPMAFALREAVFPSGNPEIVYSGLLITLALSLAMLAGGTLSFKRQVARA